MNNGKNPESVREALQNAHILVTCHVFLLLIFFGVIFGRWLAVKYIQPYFFPQEVPETFLAWIGALYG